MLCSYRDAEELKTQKLRRWAALGSIYVQNSCPFFLYAVREGFIIYLTEILVVAVEALKYL
jgi:hypothetical protein